MNDMLQYKGYFADTHFSAEDKVFFGQLNGISDLVNFEADSEAGLKKAFLEAVDDYLEICQQIKKEGN